VGFFYTFLFQGNQENTNAKSDTIYKLRFLIEIKSYQLNYSLINYYIDCCKQAKWYRRRQDGLLCKRLPSSWNPKSLWPPAIHEVCSRSQSWGPSRNMPPWQGESLDLCLQSQIISQIFIFLSQEVKSMYDMFYTRLNLHRQAYSHKTNRIIEEMWVTKIVWLDKILSKFASLSTEENLKFYFHFSMHSRLIEALLAANDHIKFKGKNK
jgi:hypothetical protein